ncbi:MAG: NAD-dependent protein deacylase [Candidatus Mycalebacterium zealandia]|nr:MAG: NAD-dependent protein deacylase [Candidatus Mycalebacterium zealandia]
MIYSLHDEAEKFLEILSGTGKGAVLTGAGISTESGIPDYRSPDKGLWEKMDQSVVSLDGFMQNPSAYYSYALELHPVRSAAKPNAGHFLFAELEARKMTNGVITQNVDGLHGEAGSKTVHELHGSIRETVCIKCGGKTPMDEVMKRVKNGQTAPECECGGILKPNAVFFGEPLPREPWNAAIELVEECGVLIVAGSSLLVTPASTLPQIALRNGAKLIILNLMETPYDKDSDLVVREKIAVFAAEATKILSDLKTEFLN